MDQRQKERSRNMLSRITFCWMDHTYPVLPCIESPQKPRLLRWNQWLTWSRRNASHILEIVSSLGRLAR